MNNIVYTLYLDFKNDLILLIQLIFSISITFNSL